MNVILLGILGLRKVFNNYRGVAIVTQPLSSIMNEKMRNSPVKTAVLTMRGNLKSEESDDADLNCLENDVIAGNYPVIIGHPESWASSRGQSILMELKVRNSVLLVGIDEFHQGQIGHWDTFRPEMMKMISRLRIFRAPLAPCVAMSATATASEVTATISNFQFRIPPVILQTSPVQSNIKIASIRRPPNNLGADGLVDKNGQSHPGYIALLQRIYLAEYVKCIRSGIVPKKCVIFCR